jgi:predicted permease
MMNLDALWRDLRHAVRVLLKSPLFTLSAVLTLALCIGANTAIYTIVDRVLLRPLPYPEPDRLAEVMTHFDKTGEDDDSQTGSAWLALRGVPAIDLAVMSGGSMGVNFVSHQQAEYVKQQRVSAGFFRVLGVPPAIGREFTDDEDRVNGPSVAVLSHSLWTRALGGDPAVIGRSVTLRGEPYTVVGVMPAAFRSDAPADVWTPLRPSPRGEGAGQNYEIIARLRPGVSWAEADGRVASAGAAVMRDLYKDRAREHLVPLQSGLAGDARQPLLILWGAVAAVLLIGCVNIAGLLVARSAARAPEIATRMALGGGRAAIVRQLLCESVLLAACGGIAGIALGSLGVHLFASLLEDAFGVTGDAALDGPVFAATAAASLLTSLVFGLLPAVQASRVNLRAAMLEGGDRAIAGTASRWPRRLMVGAEVALGVVLLVGAGLLLRTFDGLMRQRAGFDGTHVMTATLSLQDARYTTTERVNQLFDQSLDRMRTVPGVQNAAVCLTLPYERALNLGGRFVGGREIQIINMTYVTSGYFDTLRIPVERGRVFTDADHASGAGAIVVNHAFVKRYSPDQDPIGRQVVLSGTRTIVGIVGDIQQKAGWGNFGPVGAMPAAYVPAGQMSGGFFQMVHTWFSPSWIVRTSGAQAGVAADMQRAVQAVDPLLPFAKFRTLDEVRGEAVAKQRAQATLLGSLAALAFILAAVGIYGLVANSVAERTRELGIRMALGATPMQTLRVAAAPGLVLGVVGVLIGLAVARAGARVMQSLVWNVSVGDPMTFALAAGAILLMASVATLTPALRILRLNPVSALRQG